MKLNSGGNANDINDNGQSDNDTTTYPIGF